MNHQELVAKFRDDRIGSGGALRAAAGEKLFIKVNLFQNNTPSDQSNFKVWVKGRVSKALFDSVQLEDIGVVNKFENEEKQKACKSTVHNANQYSIVHLNLSTVNLYNTVNSTIQYNNQHNTMQINTV